jgi:hypothetical protein
MPRNDNLERVLSTVVTNGLKAGWLALGHNELEGGVGEYAYGGGGSVLPLLQPRSSSKSSASSASHRTPEEAAPIPVDVDVVGAERAAVDSAVLRAIRDGRDHAAAAAPRDLGTTSRGSGLGVAPISESAPRASGTLVAGENAKTEA